MWNILSTSMNYAGASFAGPTIFAIIYSSVTIWTAVFSHYLFLDCTYHESFAVDDRSDCIWRSNAHKNGLTDIVILTQRQERFERDAVLYLPTVLCECDEEERRTVSQMNLDCCTLAQLNIVSLISLP
jgi:hypothetical protein